VRQALCRLCIASALWLLIVAPLTAHDFTVTDTKLFLDGQGEYRVEMTLDVDALALGVSSSVDSEEIVVELEQLGEAEFQLAVERATRTLQRRVRIRFGGAKQLPTVLFPEMNRALAHQREPPSILGTLALLGGRVPEASTELTFGASRAFGPVQLTITDAATGSEVRHLLEAGSDSRPYLLGQSAERNAATSSSLIDYLKLGFTHIVPKGLDHILFVLGLFLLSIRLRHLLWQITAFTVAHSVTLALSISGVMSLPSKVVEPLIALSILYVAVENLFTSELKPWRPALVFGFGLLHGLGFAGVLQELGMPRGEFAEALIGFNLGVEAGQLAVVLAAFLIVGWARNRDWYRRRVVWPASIAIGLTALYWTVERIA